MLRIFVNTLRGAIIGFMVILLLAAICFSGVMAIAQGSSGIILGISAALYYSGFLGVYFGIVPGAIIAFTITCVRMIYTRNHYIPTDSILDVLKNPSTTPPSLPRTITIAGISIGSIITLFVLGFLFTTQIGVTHLMPLRMRWLQATEPFGDCQYSIALVYLDYQGYEGLCSETLLDYLNTLPSDTVTVTFEATFDYGKLRGYHIASINEFILSSESYAWPAGGVGCGGTYLPACGSKDDTRNVPWSEDTIPPK